MIFPSIMSTQQPGGVSAADLTVPQLQQHKQMLEQELSYLTDTVAKLKAAQQAYDMSSGVLGQIDPGKSNSEVLIPLTNSVFVRGNLGDCEKVMVNIGTGYFVERPIAGAKGHCDERSKVLTGNVGQFAKILAEKRQNLEMCMVILQQKLKQQQV